MSQHWVSEVARRWLVLPKRSSTDGSPAEAKETEEINSIVNDAVKLKHIRSRLSDISWWMQFAAKRLPCARTRRTRLQEDFSKDVFEPSLSSMNQACWLCGYVDLVQFAPMAETLEESEYTSAQRRIESLQSPDKHSDRFLAPITIDELRDELGHAPVQRLSL
ncbi:MAG: hypothetical protein R3C56_09305 [Pirellulaceae bacterium]